MKKLIYVLLLTTALVATACGPSTPVNPGTTGNPGGSSSVTTCQKDSDCTGTNNKCVMVSGFAVCAQGCTTSTTCGGKNCQPQPKTEDTSRKENVCVAGSNSSGAPVSLLKSGCSKDSECPNGDSCVIFGEYAVCAKNCSDDSTCGTKKCLNRTKVEDRQKGANVCADVAAINPILNRAKYEQLHACNDKIKCADGYVCQDMSGWKNGNLGVCVKVGNECTDSSQCTGDPVSASCVEVRLLGGEYKKFCGSCGWSAIDYGKASGDCNYPTETCALTKASHFPQCVKGCDSDTDCGGATPSCVLPSSASLPGKICMSKTAQIGLGDSCNTTDKKCRDGLVCFTHINGSTDGVCTYKCTTEKEDSPECIGTQEDCNSGFEVTDGVSTPSLLGCAYGNGSSGPSIPDALYGQKCTKDISCKSSLVCVKTNATDDFGVCKVGCNTYYMDTVCTSDPNSNAAGETKCKTVPSKLIVSKWSNGPAAVCQK